MLLHSESQLARYPRPEVWCDRTIDEIFQETRLRHGDRTAIVDAPNRPDLDGAQPRRLTYAQYGDFVEQTAARLLALGCVKDSIVLVQMPNLVELVALIQASLRIGAIISPVPMQYGRHEISRIMKTLERVDLAVTVGQFRGTDRLRAFTDTVTAEQSKVNVVTFGGASANTEGVCLSSIKVADYNERVAQHLAAISIAADEIATICWTSGTIAEPKGVPRSHNNWTWHGAAVVEAGNYSFGETILSPFPAVNMGGFGSALLPWWLTGGKLVLHHPIDLTLYARQLAEERVGVTLAAPAILTALLKEGSLDGHDLSALHDVPCGGAPLSPWLIGQFRDRYGIEIVNQFGSNEGTTLAAGPAEVPDPVERASYFMRIGVPGSSWGAAFAQHVETRLIDPVTGEEVTSTGTEGELLIRSPSIFPGYYRRPDLTQEAFTADEFYRTGDLFEIADDRDGRPCFLRFVGRAKELIIRGGFNIAPPEVEAVLLDHPDVTEAAVIGLPDARVGEIVCACIVSSGPRAPSLDDIIDLFRAADMARFKWPERMELLDELPRNPIGKVVKAELLQQILRRHENAAPYS